MAEPNVNRIRSELNDLIVDFGKLRDSLDDIQEQVDELVQRQVHLIVAMGLGQPVTDQEREVNWKSLTEVRRLAKELADG